MCRVMSFLSSKVRLLINLRDKKKTKFFYRKPLLIKLIKCTVWPYYSL